MESLRLRQRCFVELQAIVEVGKKGGRAGKSRATNTLKQARKPKKRRNLMSRQARETVKKAYDEAIAQGLDEAKALEKSEVVAVKTHQEAVASPQKAYDEACKQASGAFIRAIAE